MPERRRLEDERRPGGVGTPAPREPSALGRVLELQRSAGNRAVATAIGAASNAASAAAPGAGVDPKKLAEYWNVNVVEPLAKASVRVDDPAAARREEAGGSKKKQKSELSDVDRAAHVRDAYLVHAMRGLVRVRDELPPSDPEWVRVETVGRMVAGASDLLAQEGGHGQDERGILQDMIGWRSKAVELEPLVPKPEDWHQMVVLPLGQAQVHLYQDPRMALHHYHQALEWILHEVSSTPKEQPLRLQLNSLRVGIEATIDLMKARSGDEDAPDPGSRVIAAYQAAEVVGQRLLRNAGQPVPTDAGTASESAAGTEPTFTWEQANGRPLAENTELERP